MSKIFQPPGAPFDFQYVDGQSNLLGRQTNNLVATAVLAPMVAFVCPPNAFPNEGNMIEIYYWLVAIGGAGNKRFVFLIDATTVFDSGLFNFNNNNILLTIRMWRNTGANQSIFGSALLHFGAFGTNVAPATAIGAAQPTVAFNSAITFTLQGQCVNGADTLILGNTLAKVI